MYFLCYSPLSLFLNSLLCSITISPVCEEIKREEKIDKYVDSILGWILTTLMLPYLPTGEMQK
jgi:hypothetical protein